MPDQTTPPTLPLTNREVVYDDILRRKGIFDGCKSVKEMIQACEKAAADLKKYDIPEVVLDGTDVYDDYAVLITSDPIVAARLDMAAREY